jgi:hypothetical protein
MHYIEQEERAIEQARRFVGPDHAKAVAQAWLYRLERGRQELAEILSKMMRADPHILTMLTFGRQSPTQAAGAAGRQRR